MSAIAPATVDSSATGSIKAVCTNATLSADDVICVIDHAAPTPMIQEAEVGHKARGPRCAEHRMTQRCKIPFGGRSLAS